MDWTNLYEKEFKQIKNLEQQGQNRSAYVRAEELLDQAIAQNNIPGIIGSIEPLIRNMYHVDDDAHTTLLQKIASLHPAHPVVSAVVNSYLAEFLTGYYERNRYRISQIGGGDLSWDKINRWSASRIEKTIDSLYTKSVEVEELKEISSKKIVSVMDHKDSEISWELRPRLYDLLQERYLNFLKNNRLHWNPQTESVDKETVALLLQRDLSDFLEEQVVDSRIYAIIQAYHDWESSLLQADRLEGYIDVVNMRIRYVNNFIGEKYMLESIPLLQSLIKEYSTLPNRLVLDYAIADLQYRKGDYLTAYRTLSSALEQKTDNAYANNVGMIHNLQKSILAPELTVQVEDAYAVGQIPFASIHFRNLDRVRMELYPISEKEFIEWRFLNSYSREDDFKFNIDKKSIWTQTINLPQTKDYKGHQTEVLINKKLDSRAYVLRYWYKKDKLELSGLVLFQVSQMALVNASVSDQNTLYVLDRLNGKTMSGAQVEAITVDRSSKYRDRERILLNETSPGTFYPPEKQGNLYYRVTYGNDTYISPMTYQHRGRDYTSPPYRQTTVLTDRAVYKPGQLLHFKALITLSRPLDSEIIPGEIIELSLRNANGKEVWKNTFTADEWGTITGSIPIPSTGLKGRWSLQASPSGNTSIQVEEYQRPNFEVTLADSSITRLDSLIKIGGEAKTYHGFPVQNGQGQIRVELRQRHWFYRSGSQQSELIFNSDFSTDENGKFNISFEGVDPPQTESRYGTFYYYSVHITVQAGSGEIRDITKEIPLDPDKKLIQIDIPHFQALEALDSVNVQVKNALGEADSIQVKMQVSELVAPAEYKVDRYWNIPDKPMLTQSQFQNKIDLIPYDQSSSMDSWEVQKTLKSWSQNIGDEEVIDLEKIVNQSGYYRLVVTSTDGDTLNVNSFGVTNGHKNTSIVHEAIEIITSTTSAQVGETVDLTFYTPDLNKGGKIMILFPDGERQSHTLDKNRTLKIKVEEKHRGGFRVYVFGFLANRFYSKDLLIEVPWTNKELQITGLDTLSVLEVNRDISLNINVLDNDNKGLNAEVAVAIYDASLDAYKPHNWAIAHRFFKTFSNPLNLYNLSGTVGNQIDSENNYWENRGDLQPVYYPQLPNLDIGYGNRRYFGNMMRSSKVLSNAAVPAPQMESARADDAAMALVTTESMENESTPPLNVRDDFSETLLFAGKVKTDSSGMVKIPFRTNDKAGRWKVMVFAHTKALQTGIMTHTFETKKEVFLESYFPEMVRQGDKIDLTFTLFNNMNRPVSGQVQFEMRSLFGEEKNDDYLNNLGFELGAGKSVVLTLPVDIGNSKNGPLIFTTQVIDDNGKIWDASKEVVPVYPSTELVYDGKIKVLNEGEKWSGRDITGMTENSNGQVKIRIVQNMYSELLKSIPYLQSNNPVTTDQFFRNGVQALLGQFIAGEIPDFEMIYQNWKRKGELESRLAQNEDKKYVALENTPWMRQSDSGTEQMALLGLYFDEIHINQVVETNLSKWADSQNPDGGFPWIKDGESSFYITVRFLAQLEKMKWSGIESDQFTSEMGQKARNFVDSVFLRMWTEMKDKSKDSALNFEQFTSYFTQRAYDFNNSHQSSEFLEAWGELKDSIYANWSNQSNAVRAQIGVAAWHLGDKTLSQKVVDAFVDNAILDQKLGVYWRYNHQSRQSGYLEVLSSITELLILHEISSLDNGITQWVLVNKMTNDWHRNPHVTSLMLSLLKMSGDWTTTSQLEIYHHGAETTLRGIGDVDEITLSLEDLESFQIKNIQGPPVWLGVMTSRQVDIDEDITQSGNILHIEKIVTGPQRADSLRIGDQIVVRLRIETDRDLDYVNIVDPLVPGMDPGISLSGFRWAYGLSYYQTFDASSAQFFIQHLPKGEYILEYKLGTVRSGEFRHPRTKIQSYFVPEINGLDQWKSLVRIYP